MFFALRHSLCNSADQSRFHEWTSWLKKIGDGSEALFMGYPTCILSRDLRQRIVASAAENSRYQPAAEAVSDALIRASLNVRAITLDDWKAIIFEAFDATQALPATE